ncbi:hypothetical protein BU25DRAFT_259434 [Macroventuria anomochaeta]|uniref:Uncharacterized protein n=1 Tax=Macroventuria anomochaeta TaxID=301207 RepID=A0ACB6S947_9PLEO|nr:uncharacterized protein BU25DRAFT_259434 [Macroventuria anomochaeta]KAF2630527.1 hypothetical protein BU25DRAFT_259434 [Macroventuria anomochaeta]
MPRYSRFETYSDGQYTYDDRYDTGEFSTHGHSRGPSSNAFSDCTSHYGHSSPYHHASRFTRTHSSRHSGLDEHGYPMEGAYAGEEDLRRRMSRYQVDESTSTSYSDPRTRLGRDDRDCAYDFGRRSRLSEQTYSDPEDREACRERERKQAELEYQIQREQDRERRCAERESYDEYASSRRGGRRGAVTAGNDEYLAYQQALREQQQRKYEERPANVCGYGWGWFPSYEFC